MSSSQHNAAVQSVPEAVRDAASPIAMNYTAPSPNYRPNMDTSTTTTQNSYTETRKVSSVILEQTLLGTVPPQDGVRYVTVPQIEHRTTYVKRKEVRDKPVIKKIPVVTYIDHVVEVEHIVENLVHKPRKVPTPVEVPNVKDEYYDTEVIVYVDVPTPVMVKKTVEVPGDVIEIVKPVETIENRHILVPVDVEVPVVVSQTIQPRITESTKSLIVDVLDYEPEIVPIDVHVAKPVNSALEPVGEVEKRHKLVSISAAQYNTILRQLNYNLEEELKGSLPYVSEHGRIAFVQEDHAHFIVAPENVQIEGWTRPQVSHELLAAAPRSVSAVARNVSEHNHSQFGPRASGVVCCGTSRKEPTTGSVAPPSSLPMAVEAGSQQQRVVSEYATTSSFAPGPIRGVSNTSTIPVGVSPASVHQTVRSVNPEGGSIKSGAPYMGSQHPSMAPKSRVCC